jgi:hypothetical protein
MLERFIRKPLLELDKVEDVRIAGKSSLSLSEPGHLLKEGGQGPLQGRKITPDDED